MTIEFYKGYRIVPGPQLVSVNLPPVGNKVAAIGRRGSGWTPAFILEVENKETRKSYLPPGIFETEAQATEAAVSIAKDVIDGKRKDMMPRPV